MLQLQIKTDSAHTKPAQSPVKFSKRSSTVPHCPVSEIKLTWYEEQKLYDRMYESEVWKNGHFFGYRSQVASHWHTSDQAKQEAAKPLTPASAQKLHRLISTLKQEDE